MAYLQQTSDAANVATAPFRHPGPSDQINSPSQFLVDNERYRDVLEGSIQGIMIRTGDELQYANSASARIFGYGSPADMIGQPWTCLVAPEEIALHRARAEACLRGEKTLPLSSWQGLRKDGSRIWLESVARPFRWAGRPAVLAFVIDITEHKRTEQSLRASETHFRTLIENAADAIFLHAEDGTIVDVNRRACDSLGYSRDELIGMSIPQFDPFIPQEQLTHSLEQLLSGKPVTLESRHRRKDGSTFPVDIRVGSMLLDGHMHMLSIVTDISDRKQAEEALRAAQQRLQHVISSSPAVLFTMSLDAERIAGISWMSDNVTAMLGYSVDQTQDGDWWMANVHPDDLHALRGTVQRDLFKNRQVANEYRFRHRDGSYRWLRSELRLLRDCAGNPLEVVGSWSDVSQRRTLEDQFHQAQRTDAVGHLAAGIAHDFNNVLTIICGCSEYLAGRDTLDDAAKELLSQITIAGERAASLTRQLLFFSRRQVVEPRALDLNAAVTDTERMLRRLIGEDITLLCVPATGLSMIKADPGQIDQVILNLAINARDAMPQGGKLTIATADVYLDESYCALHAGVRPGPYVLLAVSDTGCGMSDAVKARIFEPFFTTKSPGAGTGLGLATVYGIVTQCAGHIDVSSEPGQGTTLRLYFPPERDRSATAGKSSPGLRLAPRGAETVLLVEDEDAVRAFVASTLTSLGYKVVDARRAAEAIALCEDAACDIDILVTDVVMPDMGGRQLADCLMALRPRIKVLFLSGYTNDALLRHGVLTSKVAFLQKPFTPSALATKLRDVLDVP